MENSDKQSISNTSNPQNIKKTKQKWSMKKKIIVIVGAIVVFIASLFVIVNTATSAPLKVSDEFVSNIQSSKASVAYDMMSSDAQIATSSADFAAVVDKIGPILTGKLNMQSKEVIAETGSDPSAKIVYEISGSDNYVHIITVNLVQDNGNWKVLNFESVKK